MAVIYHGDARELMPSMPPHGVVVSDPPFNIGFEYGKWSDNLTEQQYRMMLAICLRTPSVVIHYPDAMFTVSQALKESPERVVAWVYNANTDRQWRSVAWFGCRPDLSLVKQPYKNPTDKRVAALIEGGSEGRPLYDWWHIDQVKNVSADKTEHPCQMPMDVMTRIVAVTEGNPIIDPFMGSGTTLRAAKDLGRRVIGIEIDERYCEIAARRLAQETLGLSA